MPPRARAFWWLAALSAVVVAIPLVLALPWTKAQLFAWATAWAHDRHGLDIRASSFDYSLTALSVTARDLEVARAASPPFLRAARLDVDLSASVLGGRLGFDAIRAERPSLLLDATTMPRPGETAPASERRGGLPPLDIDTVDVQELDLALGDDARTRLVIRQVSAMLRGLAPGRLEGDLDAAGGVSVTTAGGSWHIRFDRASARLALEDARITGHLSASSSVGELQATGVVPIETGDLDLRYDAVAELGRLHHWWRASPGFSGRVTVRGTVGGPLRSPRVSFDATGPDLAWEALDDVAARVSGHVSASELVVESASLERRGATLDADGRLAFRRPGTSRINGRWNGVGPDVLAPLVSIPATSGSRALMSGGAELAWQGLRPRAVEIEGRADLTATGTAEDTGASAVLAANGRGGRWQVDYRHTLDGGTRAVLDGAVVIDGERLSRSTLDAAAELESADLGAALAQLQRFGLVLPEFVDTIGADQVGFTGAVAGTIEAPRATGTLSAGSVRMGAIHDVKLDGELSLDRFGIEVSPLKVESAGARAVLQGRLPWSGPAGSGTFDVRLDDASQLASRVPAVWAPAGALALTGRWSGSARAPEAIARLSGRGVVVNGLALDAVEGELQFTGRVLRLTNLKATQPDGGLDLTASWDLEASTFAANMASRGLAFSVLVPDRDDTLQPSVQASGVSLEAHAAGPLARPAGFVAISAASVSFDDRPAGPFAARLDADGGAVRITAEAPEHKTALNGRLTMGGAWPFDGRLTLSGSDAASLARVAGAASATVEDVAVSITTNVDLAGTMENLAGARASIAIEAFDGRLRGLPLSVTRPGRLVIEDKAVAVVEPGELVLGTTRVSFGPSDGGAPASGLTLDLDGSVQELLAAAPPWMPEDLVVEGRVNARLRLEDPLKAFVPAGEATVTISAIRRGDQELARELSIVAEADADAIRMTRLRGTVLGSLVDGRGSLPASWLGGNGEAPDPGGGVATFSLESNLGVAPMLAALTGAPADVAGVLNLAVEGRASAPRLDALSLTLTESAGAVTLGGIALKERAPTRFHLEKGLLHVDAFNWSGLESEFVASGTVGLIDGVGGRLRLEGRSSLAVLNFVIPARVDGRTSFDLEMTGPPGARELLGTIGFEDGSLVARAQRVSLADWSGTVQLEGRSLGIQNLQGQLNGGDASIDGRFSLGDAAATQALAFRVRNAFLDVPRGLRSQLDAELEWTQNEGRRRLSGSVAVTSDAYREPVTELANLVAILIDGSQGSGSPLPEFVSSTELDVQLSTTGPLMLSNSVARVELTPDLKLTGTIGKPALDGQVIVADDGSIVATGHTYRLRDSRIDFRPNDGMVPRLNVTGETRVGDYTIYLRVTGAATEIETSFFSDPPLGERDLQSMLVTGQRADTLQRGQSDQAAVGAISGDVLGVAGNFIGVDSVRVGTTDDLALMSSDVDPALRLTVSKRIGTRFELVLSDNLDDNELTWVIIYRPRPGFEFRVISRDNTEFTAEFRQEIQFGPGVSPPRTRSASRRVRERVADITVTGEPGFAAEEVLAATRLRRGDRFDFGQWLSDRERIAQLYVDRGYFSVRIVPTRRSPREETADPLVALDYRITRGPRTVLMVEGYPAPSDLMEALQDAWSENALLELLDADLSDVMRAHLVELGYLRSSVQVNVERPDPDLAQAVVRVDPGPRSTDLRIGFSGNTALNEAALLDLADTAGVDETAWLDPEPLLALVQSAYAAHGYLAAKADSGRIEFSGSTATLLVVIVEGPLARVSAVDIGGADRLGATAAAAALGLAVGSPFVAGSEQPARQRLERRYRELGYRDATVSTRATIHPDEGRVDVAVAVNEGPQYVVRDVRTTGVESTRASVVERASRIEPGSPASPAVAAETRRRLYDVGTFRSADVTFEPVDTASTVAAPASTSTAVPGDTVPVDAVVTLQESRRFLFMYGLEVTNQYQSLFDQRLNTAGVAADLRDRNFLGRGWTLGTGLRYQPQYKSARALFSVPRLGSKPIRTNVYLNGRSEDRYTTEAITLRDDEVMLTLEQRWRPWTPVELSWGYGYNFRDVSFLTTETREELLSFEGNLASLAGAIVFDRRDNLFDARNGWQASTSVEWGLQPLGSDLGYIRALARASYYQPAGPLTLASNVRWGRLQATGGVPPLSILELFFNAGGTQTVRGYRQDSLSAYTFLGSPIGGTELLVVNQEVRFPLFWLLSGVLFGDAGNTFTEEQGIVLKDMAVGVGFGIRIHTPLAPVRIDLGIPIPRPAGSWGRWHFSIGQIF